MNQIPTSFRAHLIRATLRKSRAFSSTSPNSFHQSTSTQSTPKSKARSTRLAKRAGSDSVGLPDPVSNLRPVTYGSAFESEADNLSSNSKPNTTTKSSSTHPYSLSEFNSPTTTSKLSSSANFSRVPKPYSGYFLRLVEKLQEAELIHKLRRSRADSFNQRFWSDNNSRFQSDLTNFTKQSQAQVERISAPSSSPSTSSSPESTSSSITTSSPDQLSETATSKSRSEADVELAPFYSAWLSANSKRHQRYNQTLVRQTFRDLAPAARYQMLRNWTGIVRRWEEFRRRGPG